MPEWLEPAPVPVPEEIIDAAGGNPLVAKVLYQRGFTEIDKIQAYLDPNLYETASPLDFPDMDFAIQRLQTRLTARRAYLRVGRFRRRRADLHHPAGR